jgi:antitoxin YefM
MHCGTTYLALEIRQSCIQDRLSTILNASGVSQPICAGKVTRATSESILSADDLESLNETLHALRPPGLVDDLRQAEAPLYCRPHR